MNALTNAGVLAQDKLFATLDPTARALTLPDGREVMLIDTVGLVRRLPHELVEAFKSTLEEAAGAHVILNVCDASSPECAEHLEVTAKLLKDLGCETTPVVSVMNKCDLLSSDFDLPSIGKTVMISAKEGKGLDRLLAEIQNALPKTRSRAKILLPFSKGGEAGRIRNEGVVFEEEYTPDGLLLDAVVPIYILDELKEFVLSVEP